MSRKLKQEQRLRSASDFNLVRERGVVFHSSSFIANYWVRPAELSLGGIRRFGVIASKRVGGAVERNRGKRLLRELFRKYQEDLPGSIDLILIARKSILRFSFEELEAHFLKTCEAITKALS